MLYTLKSVGVGLAPTANAPIQKSAYAHVEDNWFELKSALLEMAHEILGVMKPVPKSDSSQILKLKTPLRGKIITFKKWQSSGLSSDKMA